MSRPLLSLDFYGNEIIAALAAWDDETDTIRLRHIFRQPCKAFSGALVRDMDSARNELGELFEELAHYTPHAPSVIVGLRGPFLSFKRSSGFKSIDSRNRLIGTREMEAAIRNSVPTSLSETLEVVDILPQSYTIDGNIGILNPKGMSGFTLEVETFLSCALSTHLNTLNSVLTSCGCEDYQLLPSSIALGETIVKEDEKTIGTLLLDIGATHTSAIMYHKGTLVDAWELPLGQESITEMVADLLQNDLPTVRDLLFTYEPGSDEIMDEVLEDAQIKLLQRLKKELLQSSLLYLKHPSTNLILCGEQTDKPFLKLVKKIFGARKIRSGAVDHLMTDCAEDVPAAAGAVSLLHHSLEREQNRLGVSQAKPSGLLDGFLSKLGFGQLFE